MDEQNSEKNEKIKSSRSISSNDLFTTIYDITRVIFRHLPIYSVDSCSLVCRSWAHTARLTKAHRHTIHALTYPPNSSSSTTKCPYLLSDFDAFISSYVKNSLWSIPSLAFIVTTNSLKRNGFHLSSSSPPPTKDSRRFRSQTTVRRMRRFDILQALTPYLNKSCKILLASSDGIIVSNDENQSREIESGAALGILFFPKVSLDVLGMYPFKFSCHTQIPADMSRSDLHRLLGCVPDHKSIRCVVFFFSERQPLIARSIRKLHEFYSSSVAIIGGSVNKVYYDDRQDQRQSSLQTACGIVLTGDPNYLNIRQVVLEGDANTREVIRDKLKQLKSNENNQCLSFAIQVSCVARGSDFYDEEKNVECSEFRSLFPGTPLIGLFGNGEIGHDYILDDSQTLQQQIKAKHANDDLFRSYSTVFSLIVLRL